MGNIISGNDDWISDENLMIRFKNKRKVTILRHDRESPSYEEANIELENEKK